MKILGVFFFLLASYGSLASYRILRYRELYWAYPLLRYRKEKGYSRFICNLVGIGSIPIILVFYILAMLMFFPKE
ncbi:MAG: hypothetical protein HZC48_01345 [Nitrospirae bacterium]|nr:hypothetical protein [Nitrospirota bacterium]